MSSLNYPFITLKTPKEVIGSTLDNKANHAIYQAITINTSISNAKLNGLFNTSMEIPGIRTGSKSELTYPIKRLIEDNLIQQIFTLQYAEGMGFQVQTSYIAIPQDKPDKIDNVFTQVLEQSVKNITNYIDNIIIFDTISFAKELKLNLEQNAVFSSNNYPTAILDPFSSIAKYSSEIPLNKGVIDGTATEIEQELILAGKIAKLTDGVFIPIADKDLLARYETADRFIKDEIYPLHKTKTQEEIEKINHEEEIISMEKFGDQGLDLKRKRAEILDKAISAAFSGSAHYPGSLAIMTVLLLDRLANDKYKAKEEEEIKQGYESYLKTMAKTSTRWIEMILFLDQKIIGDTHPEIWVKLKKDKRISFTTWIHKGNEYYILSNKDKSVIVKSITDMSDHPPSEKWKILAFRQLVEDTEKSIPDIFSDKKTIKAYGSLLKKAYVAYFPWYYPFLIHFSFFLDLFFKKAKDSIKAEQEAQKKRKEKQDNEKNNKLAAEKLKRIEESKADRTKHQIIMSIEDIAFKSEKIPFYTDVMKLSNIENEAYFDEMLKNENFQLIPLKKNAGKEETVVLFPIDHQWRGREARLKSVLNKQINVLTEKHGEKKILLPFKLLYNILGKQSKSPESSSVTLAEDDKETISL